MSPGVFPFFLWQLPQLDPIAVGIGDPGESSVAVVFAVRIDLDSLFRKRFQQAIQIVDAIVDHEGGGAGIEVFRTPWEDAPDRHPLFPGVCGVTPVESHT